LLTAAAVLVIVVLLLDRPNTAHATKPCTVADLNGTYVFTATGFGAPPGGTGPTAPKAIIEVLRFNGDGTVDTPKVTLSVNGTIIKESPGTSGTYTAVEISSADGLCTGTLNFNGGAPNFDLYFAPSGSSDISLIQTDGGNVFRGTATKAVH
jgi:hypothetical protein